MVFIRGRLVCMILVTADLLATLRHFPLLSLTGCVNLRVVLLLRPNTLLFFLQRLLKAVQLCDLMECGFHRLIFMAARATLRLQR